MKVVVALEKLSDSDSVDQDRTAENVKSDLDLHCPIRKYFFTRKITLELQYLGFFTIGLKGHLTLHHSSRLITALKKMPFENIVGKNTVNLWWHISAARYEIAIMIILVNYRDKTKIFMIKISR